MDVDGRAGGRSQPPVPRHVVGVVVRLEDVLDVDAEISREVQVLVDLELRVDDGRDARLVVADQVGRAAEVVVGDLAEDHASRRPKPGTNRPTRAAYSPYASPCVRRSCGSSTIRTWISSASRSIASPTSATT